MPPSGRLGSAPVWELVMTVSVVATVPMLLFVAAQRYFIEGANPQRR